MPADGQQIAFQTEPRVWTRPAGERRERSRLDDSPGLWMKKPLIVAGRRRPCFSVSTGQGTAVPFTPHPGQAPYVLARPGRTAPVPTHRPIQRHNGTIGAQPSHDPDPETPTEPPRLVWTSTRHSKPLLVPFDMSSAPN
ncbi:hypothetical protein DPEC_G00268460 [Dallia pectoralis]|uniref:Uncharacterized protein n=1 Tax=Dallia pectoralis TaxID=75939 RepID=A0ACC2FNT2_DALPE|nr:hypothetical protein DPEC_G00268460 [Dallia pectoralis]